MTRYVLELSYDGCVFNGSQIQGSQPTVQLALNNALSILLRQPVETYGASRTDEGVHALANYYHFDTELILNAHSQYQLNALLPMAVSVNRMFRAAHDFNVRFDALSRQYRYRIYCKKNPFLQHRALHFPYKLNRPLLDATAAALKAYSDFESFSKRGAQTRTYRCQIFQSFWEDAGDELQYVVEANRFLRGMVRGLVGTQLRAARGKYDLDTFHRIIQSKDCSQADFSPKGWGLYLERIQFPEGALLPLEH
ncbi:MAG: tRNA pseudouridine synthase A [Bacteroidetes bacterium]|nr:tRNA pseudouridine synthase A [Bacteroidota bacterium]MBS1630536.1 tRNA pseudouridine synthase A [Bacteroidota bacterium]